MIKVHLDENQTYYLKKWLNKPTSITYMLSTLGLLGLIEITFDVPSKKEPSDAQRR